MSLPYNASQETVTKSVNALLANAKGVVVHGADNDVTRPSGFVSVEWVGTVEPLNAINGDTWVNPAA